VLSAAAGAHTSGGLVSGPSTLNSEATGTVTQPSQPLIFEPETRESRRNHKTSGSRTNWQRLCSPSSVEMAISFDHHQELIMAATKTTPKTSGKITKNLPPKKTGNIKGGKKNMGPGV
jgi:hypothetical protein